MANRVLKLKTARFSSIDRESHYLVRNTSDRPGVALLLPEGERLTEEVSRKTRLDL